MLKTENNAEESYVTAIRREMLTKVISRVSSGMGEKQGIEEKFDFQLQELQQLVENYKSPTAVKAFGSIFFNRCQKELERLLRIAQIADAERKASSIVDVYKHRANFQNESVNTFFNVAEAV